MPRYVRLTDSDVSRIVSYYTSGRERYLIESALQMAIREGGSTIAMEYLYEVLADLTRNLITDSLANSILGAIEREYEEQQEAAA